MSRHSSISGTPLEEADVLQREFDRVMAGTSSLPEPQQMLIEDHYLQMVQKIVDLSREQLRQRRTNRQSIGHSMSSSFGFEEISLSDSSDSGSHGGNGNGSGAGAGAGSAIPEVRVLPATWQGRLDVMRKFIITATTYFCDGMLWLWNRLCVFVTEFTSFVASLLPASTTAIRQ